MTDMEQLHKITNHPVHVYDEDGALSPSAFIPFCQFGTNILAMGRETSLFNVPVCQSFKAKIFYNQLCYEVDVHDFIDRDSMTSSELKLGLSLLVDVNFNRQYSLREKINRATLNKTIGEN